MVPIFGSDDELRGGGLSRSATVADTGSTFTLRTAAVMLMIVLRPNRCKHFCG